jgi:hypothetical protein
VRARELWRIPEPYLAEAQDDAALVAIKAQVQGWCARSFETRVPCA